MKLLDLSPFLLRVLGLDPFDYLLQRSLAASLLAQELQAVLVAGDGEYVGQQLLQVGVILFTFLTRFGRYCLLRAMRLGTICIATLLHEGSGNLLRVHFAKAPGADEECLARSSKHQLFNF